MAEAISSSLPLLALCPPRSSPPVAKMSTQRCLGWVSQCSHPPQAHQEFPAAQQRLPCMTQSLRTLRTHIMQQVSYQTQSGVPFLVGVGSTCWTRTLDNSTCWECSGVRLAPGTLSFDTRTLARYTIPCRLGIWWFQPSNVKPQLGFVNPHFLGKCFNHWVLSKRWALRASVLTF